jgi:pyocin large subunit-like protein
MRRAFGAALAVLVLGACDAGPSAVPARDHAAAGASAIETATASAPVTTPIAPARTTLVDGKPIWSSNRSLTAEENAKAHFEKDGADFGARSVAEFVAKTHAFTTKPPKGTQKLTRPNGDVLLYDPAGNVFAVVTRTGAPRTIFKPRNGVAYWEQQKKIEAARKG